MGFKFFILILFIFTNIAFISAQAKKKSSNDIGFDRFFKDRTEKCD
jgi:hypothetical protein